MARILDFYAVDWQYEPVTFPILWNLEGDVVESFSPDFYLPDLDLFLEMTTLKQRLVRKKNRKLRRLRELYPDIRIKLFYARDFRAMMLKYGRFGLIESLSGTLGQIVPDRSEPRSPAAPLTAADVVESTPAPIDPTGSPESASRVGAASPELASRPELASPPVSAIRPVLAAPSEPAPAPASPRATRARRRRRRTAGVSVGSPARSPSDPDARARTAP
jgi:hypothetical protein